MRQFTTKQLTLVWTILLFGLLAYVSIRGFKKTLEYNDFEVFYYGATMALERNSDLYITDSPIKDRPFIYPPSASILFAPMKTLPYPAAAVFHNILKLGTILGLLYISVRFLGPQSLPRHRLIGICALTFLTCLRPINSDFGNGQVNIHLAFLTIAGVILLMRGKTEWIFGALLIAIATAIKLTPILLVAVPFLFKRWTGFFASLIFSVFLLFLVPFLWFGGNIFTQLQSDYRNEVEHKLVLTAKYDDSLASIHEMIIFTLSQARAPEDIQWDGDEFYRVVDGDEVEVTIPDPLTPEQARNIWLIIGILGGISYLSIRWLLFSKRGYDWTWDVAMLCVYSILLSPLARKAHLVLLVVPVLWIIMYGYMVVVANGGVKAAILKDRVFAALFVGIFISFSQANDFAVPFPGFPMPYYPLLFVGTCLIFVTLLHLAKKYPADSLGVLQIANVPQQGNSQ